MPKTGSPLRGVRELIHDRLKVVGDDHEDPEIREAMVVLRHDLEQVVNDLRVLETRLQEDEQSKPSNWLARVRITEEVQRALTVLESEWTRAAHLRDGRAVQ